MAEANVAPHMLEAERSILGAVVAYPDRLFDIVDEIRPADFFRAAHTKIYQAVLDLSERGHAIDFITLQDRLREKGQLEDVGGPAYLAGLADGMPHSANVLHYARIVREDAMLRGVIRAASDMLTDAHRPDAEAREVLDRAEKNIYEIAQRTVRGDFVSAPQLVAEGYSVVERLLEEKKGVTGVSSGFSDLDSMTRGFQPGALTLIAGRPSMGKTAFALNVAYNAAAKGKSVGFFSIEMDRQAVLLRLLAAVGRIDGHRLQSGIVNPTDYGHISHAFGAIAESGLHLDDTPNLSVLDVRGKARRLKARSGLDLVIIDYLQLMQVPRAENRNLAVAEVSRALKLIARELDVPVLALSQLSRDTERRGEKKPMLSDLRDSGALEQDADLVLFLHRPEVYAPKPENAGLAEVLIAKQRNGPIGTVTLKWMAQSTRFDSKEQE